LISLHQTAALALTAAILSAPAEAKIHRSHAAIAQFKREQPCPATGNQIGRCPGWIIDHIIALACGGPDTSTNMQWQTIDDAKKKDRLERLGCAHTKGRK
jgi:hypothetical protein